MTALDAAAVMEGLKGFQRDAVDHVIRRLYDEPDASGRFLVADETGLGKSIIARGVIARAVERLEQVDAVDRIDVVYVCSNADLARQNLRRLNVTGQDQVEVSTRLTLLAKESSRLAAPSPDGRKKVNLVSFTPGTSFTEGGWRQGNAEERALLTLILDELVGATRSDRRVTQLMLCGTVKNRAHFDYWYIAPMRRSLDDHGGLDRRIVDDFGRRIRRNGALDRFLELRDELRYKRTIPPELKNRIHDLTAEMRQCLARASVESLEPDLVILDEFQRFRNLLDPGSGEAGELADALFRYPDSRVLLLSATPYKPFTNADDLGDDHYRDFLTTIRFLAGGQAGAEQPVADALARYRRALVTGGDVQAAADAVRAVLLPLMSRSERPPLSRHDDLVDVQRLPVDPPTAGEIRDWTALHALGKILGAPIDIEYWKSIPYFASFMDGYKPESRLRDVVQAADTTGSVTDRSRAAAAIAALGRAASLDHGRVASFDAIDLGSGNLRALADATVNNGWWRLLWVPPTMPYLEPGPIYREFSDGSVTKQLIFSSWSAVPTAIASLLSYQADRLTASRTSDALPSNTPEGRRAVPPRLTYRLADGRPAGMSSLALFWPHPGLAERADQLAAAREHGGRINAGTLLEQIADRPETDAESADQAWEAFFSEPGFLPAEVAAASGADARVSAAQIRALLPDGENDGEADDDRDGRRGLDEHVRLALETGNRGDKPCRHHPGMAALIAFSPGGLAFRSLQTIAGPEVSPRGLWSAAFELAEGIRTLFNRTESILTLTAIYGDDRPYWRSVLDYCADGNLRAVLDEYLFQLHSETGGNALDDAGLAAVARHAAAALSLKPARYRPKDNTAERADVPMIARFALRYGGKYDANVTERAAHRQELVRAAFNSPFAPFVLASTSVGQEGIDFHWWCHAVVHWNLPSNPVDFEQREGRVNRYAGHAVRKNVAARHWRDVLVSTDAGAWRAAFAAAERTPNDLGEFSPWWVYPGPARIHRVLAQYPFSRDIARYERLRTELTLYRLTLGQPRQTDMVDMLAQRGVAAEDVPAIDLRPPRGA